MFTAIKVVILLPLSLVLRVSSRRASKQNTLEGFLNAKLEKEVLPFISAAF
jgi:hypothetical protein